MPALSPRHELFAQARARGETADQAYVSAGFKRHSGNAARLSGNEWIKERIAEIQAKIEERTIEKATRTRDDLSRILVEMMDSDAEMTAAARIAAIREYGKLHGLYPAEPQEVTHNIALDEILAKLCGRGLPAMPTRNHP